MLKKKRPTKRRRQWVRLKRAYKRWQRYWQRSKILIVRSTLAVLFAILLLFFVLLVFSPLLHVRTIAIAQTSSRLDQEEVQTVLAPLFNEHLFFVSTDDVERLLVEQRQDVESVTIEKRYPSELRVIITLQPVIATLKIIEPDAAESPEANNGSLYHFITANGLYVQTLLPTASGTVLPELHIVDWSIKPQSNTVLLPPQLLTDLFEAERILADEFGHEITKRTIYVRAQEYHIQIGDRTLWFDIRSALSEQIERYQLFLESQINFPVLQYIDLRLHDRIIWK